MRVAVATWSGRRVGGIEEYISDVIPALRAAGHAVMLWHEMDGPGDRDPIAVPRDVPIVGANSLGIKPAIEMLRDWQPDVIYIQGLVDSTLGPQLAEIAPSVFFVHTYAGMCISGGKTFTRPSVVPCDRRFGWPCLLHYFPHGCGGRNPMTMWRHYRRQQTRLSAYGRYHAILTHTDHMCCELAKHGLQAEALAYPVSSPGAMAVQEDSGPWRLLFAGRMDFLKGSLYLLEALPNVVSRLDRPIRMTFAGDGCDRPKLESRAHEIQGRLPKLEVVFTGWVFRGQVSALLEDTDLLVVPSLWPEPFGTVGPAAGCHGVPAAAFAVGGIPHWLHDGMNGHLAPGHPPTPSGLADAILKCLSDPKHYADLQEGASRVAATFSMQEHLLQLLRVFRRVTAAPAVAAASHG